MESESFCVGCFKKIFGQRIEIEMLVKMFYNCKPTKFPGESEYPNREYDTPDREDRGEIKGFIVALEIKDNGEPRIEEKKFTLRFCNQDHAGMFDGNLHKNIQSILQGDYPFAISFESKIFPLPKLN